MHVRVARFEGIDTTNLDRDMEEFRQMIHMQERPEACRRRRSRPSRTA